MLNHGKVAQWVVFVLVSAGFIFGGSSAAHACTGITLEGKDGTLVFGRTMEWGHFDLKPRATVFPRSMGFKSTMPEGGTGRKWESQYGVVGTWCLNDYLADGMNEAGLAGGTFYHAGFAEYAEYDPAREAQSISSADVLMYILTNFKKIEEVRKGLEKIRVVPVKDPILGKVAPFHLMLAEPDGDSAVIEFKDVEIKFYDNPVGVITNNPRFPWHLTNLRNYGFLEIKPFSETKWGELKITPLASGSGLLGLPGDYTSPSRFVRAVALKHVGQQTSGGIETVNEFFRILDSFNVPAGQGEGSNPDKGDPLPSDTMYTICYDTSDKKIYYHTAYNRRVRRIDLGGFDYSKGQRRGFPFDAKRVQDVKDVTNKLR